MRPVTRPFGRSQRGLDWVTRNVNVELDVMECMEHWLTNPLISTDEMHRCQRLYWEAQSLAIGWASR